MKQTLGQRIADHRKRLKLTQDQLAERLGITAQAISKWEHDQSCPDITMLPRLAAIFGTTTDELLGIDAPGPVHDGEVVDHGTQSGINVEFGSSDNSGKWQLHWDSGKENALVFAGLVLLVGILLLVTRMLRIDVSFWSILWPSTLLVYGLKGLLRKFSVFHTGVVLFGGYSLVHNMGIWKLDIAEELVFPIMVVLFGLGLLVDAIRKPRKPRFRIVHAGSGDGELDEEERYSASTSGNHFHCSMNFGNKTNHVELPVLGGGNASVSFGSLTVDLQQCTQVEDDCEIEAECNFGELTFLVPRKFHVIPDSDTAFASLNIHGHPDETPVGTISMDADINFGKIIIEYV